MLGKIRKFLKTFGNDEGGKILKPLPHWALNAVTGVLVEVTEHGGTDRVTVRLGAVDYECKDLRKFRHFPGMGSLVSLALCKPGEDGLRPLLWVYEGDAKSNLEDYNRRHWIAG